MIFIWGKKVVRHSIGYVADFCPVCRDLTRFEVRRVGMAGHFYYIPLGEGTLLGHERTCYQCGIDLNARPEAYKSIARQRLAPRELAPITRPDWQEAHAQRLALERHLATGMDPLPAEVRKALIFEPFDLLSPRVEAYLGKVSLDGRSWAAVGLLFVLLYVAAKLSNEYPTQFALFYGAAFVIGFGVIAWQMMGGTKRYFERKVYPVLHRSLRPLRPTDPELESVVSAMRAVGRKIGTKLDLGMLSRGMTPDPHSPRVLPRMDEEEQSRARA